MATGFKGFERRMVTAPGRETGRIVEVEVLTSVLALLSFRSGLEASLTTSWDVWRTGQPNIEIHGTLGSLSLPHPNYHGGPLRLAVPGGAWEEVPLEAFPMARSNWPAAVPEHCNYRGIGIAEMIDAVAGDRAHRLSADLGAHVVEAADAIIASAGSRLAVALALRPERPEPFSAQQCRALLRSSDEDR